MSKYRIIGNMTGNSMDAVDLVLTEFDGDVMTDISSFTKPYTKDMQERIEGLREKVFNKTRSEIERLPEFISVHDDYIRQHTEDIFDTNGKYGRKGLLDKTLLQELFNFGRQYYEAPVPKSGDPAYYSKKEIFEYVEQKGIDVEDVVHTFEYFAAYVAVQALSLVPEGIHMPKDMVLFGGGWKNPVVKESFERLLNGDGYVLPEHIVQFERLRRRFANKPVVRNSALGDYMEARLFADLARYKLENRVWEIPEIVQAGKSVVCGRIAKPKQRGGKYDDCINRAAKGWQEE